MIDSSTYSPSASGRVSVPQLPSPAMVAAGKAVLRARRPLLARFLGPADIESIFIAMCREMLNSPYAAIPQPGLMISVPQLPTHEMNSAGVRVAKLFHPIIGRYLRWSDIEAVYVAMCVADKAAEGAKGYTVPPQSSAGLSPAYSQAMDFASESWGRKFEPYFEGFSPREKVLLKAAFEGGFRARGVLEDA